MNKLFLCVLLLSLAVLSGCAGQDRYDPFETTYLSCPRGYEIRINKYGTGEGSVACIGTHKYCTRQTEQCGQYMGEVTNDKENNRLVECLVECAEKGPLSQSK